MPLPNGDPSAAEVLALSNRLLAQKNAPGWYDLVAIAERLKEQAHATVDDYKSGDKDPLLAKEELFDLKRRADIADALIVELFGYVDWAIEQGKGMPGFQSEDPRPQMITTKVAGSY